MSEIQIVLEHRIAQLEGALLQAREALEPMRNSRDDTLAAIDAVLSGASVKEVSQCEEMRLLLGENLTHDEAMSELRRLIKAEEGMPDWVAYAKASVPAKELSGERILELAKREFCLPDVAMQKKLYAFAQTILREVGK